MGMIISRFRRKKTTAEVLEKLETNIKKIEQDGHSKERAHKRVIGYMMAYSVGLYVIFAVLYYYMFAGKNQHWVHSLMCASPLLVLPVLVIFLRSGISWYYNWSLTKTRLKLNKMKEEKKKLLEEVMNTETYKVAKQILDKYGGGEEQSRALKPFVPTSNVPGNATPRNTSLATPGQLRQRQLMNSAQPVGNSTPAITANNATPTLTFKSPRLRSEQLPRPLPESPRTAMDKVIDYLLKEGPNYRMALICCECNSHNGMAMIEEFEFVSYNCAYCGAKNAARKQRPSAPLLRTSYAPQITPVRALPAPRRIGGAGDDSSGASSGSDSGDEKSPVSNIGDTDHERDRSPSAREESPKPDIEKKED